MSNYCVACYNNEVYIILSCQLYIIIAVSWLKTHRNYDSIASLLVSLHRLSTPQKRNVFIFILNKFGKTIRNSTISLIEQLLH